jgi:hypothetical protein
MSIKPADLPLRAGLYVTRNKRIVRLLGQYESGNWWGRFEYPAPSSGKFPVGKCVWFPSGKSASGRPVWDLIQSWEEKG